jgi:hypothetical protein
MASTSVKRKRDCMAVMSESSTNILAGKSKRSCSLMAGESIKKIIQKVHENIKSEPTKH